MGNVDVQRRVIDGLAWLHDIYLADEVAAHQPDLVATMVATLVATMVRMAPMTKRKIPSPRLMIPCFLVVISFRPARTKDTPE